MVISDDQKIADIFIEYFDTIVPKLSLTIPKHVIVATNGIEDSVLRQCINIRSMLVYLRSKKTIIM